MSESEDQVEEKKKSPLAIILAVFALLAIVLAIGLINNAKIVKTDTATENVANVSDSTTTPDTIKTVATPIENTEEIEAASSFDLEKAATPRILGDINAPLKISEHSSFTCSHCADFHKVNFKQIKRDFIDTGKAYLIFDDFPRNQYDLKIGSIARCVPEDSYFKFVQLLFETQEDWLNDDYLGYIKQNAKLTGASEAQINSCLNSTELLDVLSKRQQNAMGNYNVTGTPSLVLNDGVAISGLTPYVELKAALDAAFEKAH